jgi:hypothetical protein
VATGYRSLPPGIASPAMARVLSEQEFSNLHAQKLQDAPPACNGHEGTTIWYAKGAGYIVQVKLDGNRSVYAESICTFTPTFGMDKIDGLFAQDVEEYVLNQELSLKSERLAIFAGRASVPVAEYLRDRGAMK